MFISLGIGLYTSRVVLKVLGVEDFGIYSIVGGIVAIFSFLHGALSGTTTRFLNMAMVEDFAVSKRVFSTALIIHIILCIVILILAETVGLWFLYNKLNIPNGRFEVSFWVYQISVVSILFTVMQIPYDAVIIAREKMNVFAYVSILESLLKLGVIYLVSFSSVDKLLSYSILILIVAILVRMIAQQYCKRNFKETTFQLLFDRDIFKKMLSFFGWDLYGNMGLVIKLQGVNIIQNMFFGPIINASIAISSQLEGGIVALGYNFSLSAKPQIIQSFARKDYERIRVLLSQGTRLSFYFILLIALPLSFNTKFLLQLWLGEVPKYADVFLQLSLLSVILSISFSLLYPIIHATGKMALFNLITGSLYLVSLPISYVLLKLYMNPILPYYLNFFIIALSGVSNLFFINRYVPELKIFDFIKRTMIIMYSHFVILFLIFYFVIKKLEIYPLFEILISFFVILIFIYVFVLKVKDRQKILKNILSKLT